MPEGQNSNDGSDRQILSAADNKALSFAVDLQDVPWTPGKAKSFPLPYRVEPQSLMAT